MLLQIVWLCSVVTAVLCITTDKQEDHWNYLGIAVEPDYIILVPQKNCKPGERRDFFGNCRPVLNSSKKNSQKENYRSSETEGPKKNIQTSIPSISISANTPPKDPLSFVRQYQKSYRPLKNILFPKITANISEIMRDNSGLHISSENLAKNKPHKINISSLLMPPLNLSAVNTSAINVYDINIPVADSPGAETIDIKLPVINASAVNISDISS